MKHGLLALMLCAAAALAPAPVASAAERAPTELWDRFPLEPTATPAAAGSPEATPRTRVVERPSDEGMDSGALIALMVAAGALGAVAARVAARRLPRAPLLVSVPEHATPAPDAPEKNETAPSLVAQPAPPKHRAPAAAVEPAVEPAPTPAAPQPSDEPTPKPSAPQPTPSPAGKRRHRRARRAGKQRAMPPAEPRTEQRATKPGTQRPAKRPPTRRVEPLPTGRFTPTPATGCAIKLSKRPPLGRFVAVADRGDRVVARSPIFKLDRSGDDSGPTPPEALRALVRELTSAGWRKTGAGRAPWELRFERQPEVVPGAGPPRA